MTFTRYKDLKTCRKAVALLDEQSIQFEYREYKKDPSLIELQDLMTKLSAPASTLLRKRDKAQGKQPHEPKMMRHC